jgi:hypothetical protein
MSGDKDRLARSSFIISLGSFIIALCALGLSIYQGYLQKENYQISVQPYITVVPTIDGEKKEYGYYIYNAGQGKGYINMVQYFINGSEVRGGNLISLKKVVSQFGLNENCFSYGNPRKGDSVSLDQMNKLLTISNDAYSNSECKGTIEKFHTYLTENPSKFSIRIFYRSIYNISYLYNSEDNSQKKIQ